MFPTIPCQSDPYINLPQNPQFSPYQTFPNKPLPITNIKPNMTPNNPRRRRNWIPVNRDNPIVIDDDDTINTINNNEPINYDTTTYCICENHDEYDYIVECVNLRTHNCKNPHNTSDWHAECAGWTNLTTDPGPSSNKDIYISTSISTNVCTVWYTTGTNAKA